MSFSTSATPSEARALLRAHIFHSGDVDLAPCRFPSEQYNHLAQDTGMHRTLHPNDGGRGRLRLARRVYPARVPPPQLPPAPPARLGAALQHPSNQDRAAALPDSSYSQRRSTHESPASTRRETSPPVRHVLLFPRHPRHFPAVERIHAACPGLVNLALVTTIGLFPDPHLGARRPVHFAHPLFVSVTHLDVFDELDFAMDWDWVQGAAALPRLTHLALNNRTDYAVPAYVIRQLADSARGLHCGAADDARPFAAAVPFSDLRLVVAACREYFPDWELARRD
ncbi:hypothetical protein FB451DRAFT_1395072 [Mycena latifolia]|nr:hypothetical protein FB451DRAFT_1395072 [Mycena latifolia]